MSVKSGSISLNTQGGTDILNITGQLIQLVAESGLHSGIVTIFCPSSTSGLTTIEYEPGAVSDLKRLFEELVPAGRAYAHEAAWGDGNGHSHVRAALLGASLTIPLVEKTLTLGTWQEVIYIDFDVRPRQRELVVQMVGE
jgi:secondary thiamine-phosphate synthase enzyme